MSVLLGMSDTHFERAKLGNILWIKRIFFQYIKKVLWHDQNIFCFLEKPLQTPVKTEQNLYLQMQHLQCKISQGCKEISQLDSLLGEAWLSKFGKV